MTLARKREAIVKITAPKDGLRPALINERNRAPIYQYLGPDTRLALGETGTGYFAAERIGNIWIVGAKIPHDLGW